MDQASHWDQVTRDLVTSRLTPPSGMEFFGPDEAGCAAALLNLLTGQQDDPRIPVLEMVDARLAAGETDGWRYGDMPEDGRAWRDTLGYLDADSQGRCGLPFAEAAEKEQLAVIQVVQDLKSGTWHGLNASPRLEPVDPLRLHRAVRPPTGLGRDRLLRPGLSARLQERRRGQA